MTKYTTININFSNEQLKHLSLAYKQKKVISFRIKHNNIFVGNPYIIGQRQFNKIKKRYNKGLGSPIKFSVRLLTANKRNGNLLYMKATGLEPINEKIPFDTTSNFDLQNIIDYVGIPNFKGVLPHDKKYFTNFNPNECGIINLESDKFGGSHWCAYYCNENSEYDYYFDSYGVYPTQTLLEYLKTNSKKLILASTMRIQPDGTTLCGFYSVCFIIYMAQNNADITGFLSYFKDNGDKYNDTVIKEMSKYYFGELIKK